MKYSARVGTEGRRPNPELDYSGASRFRPSWAGLARTRA